MNKITTSMAAIAGLLGLALVMRTDISNLLPIGVALIILSGALIYISLSKLEKKAEVERKTLVESLSPDEMKTTLKDALVMISNNLLKLNETVNAHSNSLLKEINENHQSVLQIYELLKQIPGCVEQNSERVRLGALVAADRMHNEFASVSKQMTDAMQTNAETFFEKQQIMSETIISKLEEINSVIVAALDDTTDSLKESAEIQSNSAEDAVDKIKRTMKSTNDAINELIISLERLGIQNSEMMQNASNGYNQFEIVLNKSLEQMSSISKQDFDLLKELINE